MVGVDTFGIYSYVYAWMVVLAYCATLGFDVALLRFLPAYQAEDAWALLKGIILYAQRRAAAVGISVISVGMLIILVIAPEIPAEIRNTFLVGFALVPVWALLWIRCAMVRAFGGVASALVPDKIIRDGMLLVIVALASWGLGRKFSAPAVMTATLISSAAALVVTSLAIRRLRPDAIEGIPAEFAATTWRRTILPLVILAATEALMNRSGVLLLGWMGHTADAGIYGLAFNIAFLTALPRTALNTLFAPTLSHLHARKDRAMMQMLTARSASWTLGAAACIAIILSVLAGPLLTWFGRGYEAGVPVLRILLIGQVFAASAGSQLQIMTMTGQERSAAVLLSASAAVNALAGIVFIQLFGLIGAAIATTIGLIIWNSAMAFFIWRRLQLLPGVLGLSRMSISRAHVP
jgi:O-antigen/teichoic acid export membrane protein